VPLALYVTNKNREISISALFLPFFDGSKDSLEA
jgi:hypothetical protein